MSSHQEIDPFLKTIASKRVKNDLQNLCKVDNLNEVDKFSFAGSVRAGRVASVVDGDTVWLVMMHENEPRRFCVRLLGIDAPEMRPPLACVEREKIKKEALRAKHALENQLDAIKNLVYVHCHQFGKYGRILVTLHTLTGINLNEWLVNNGYVVKASKGRIQWSQMWPQLQKARERCLTKKAIVDNSNSSASSSINSVKRSVNRSVSINPQRQERQPRNNFRKRLGRRILSCFRC